MKNFLKVFAAILIMSVMLISTPEQASAAESKGYYIKVNKGTNVVTVYRVKDDKPIKAMICSAGVPTPTGTFYTMQKYVWKELIGPSYGQYSTRIVDGILFHSVFYWTNYDKSSMSTSAYNLLGTLQSHGCVRLLMKDTKWIYDNCALGTKVIIFNGTSKDDPLGKPTYAKIPNGQYTNWDPTDPDPDNPWNKCKPSIKITGSRSVQYKSTFDPLSRVTIKDSLGNVITSGVKVRGKVNTNKMGSYKVTFRYKDWLGRSVKRSVTFIVRDMSAPTISGIKTRSVAVGQEINLLKGISSKAVTGESLTSKVRVYFHNGKEYRYLKSGKKTFTKAKTYKLKYYVKGPNKKSTTIYSSVKVINKKVKLTVNNITLEYGAKFKPRLYATLTNYKGTAMNKSRITVKHSVNTKKLGTYNVTYTAMNKNKPYTKVTKTIKVKVVNKLAPVIYGVNTSDKLITIGTDSTILNLKDGVSAQTATRLKINSHLKIYVNGTLFTGTTYDFSTPGTYTVKYKVSVPNGKKSTTGFTVTVVEPEVVEPEVPEDETPETDSPENIPETNIPEETTPVA